MSNGSGNGGWLWKWAATLLEKHGLSTVLSLVFAGGLLWVVNVLATKHDVKLDAILAGQLKVEERATAQSAIQSRLVLILESIDRRMCLRDARNDRERDQCVAPPR